MNCVHLSRGSSTRNARATPTFLPRIIYVPRTAYRKPRHGHGTHDEGRHYLLRCFPPLGRRPVRRRGPVGLLLRVTVPRLHQLCEWSSDKSHERSKLLLHFISPLMYIPVLGWRYLRSELRAVGKCGADEEREHRVPAREAGVHPQHGGGLCPPLPPHRVSQCPPVFQ